MRDSVVVVCGCFVEALWQVRFFIRASRFIQKQTNQALTWYWYIICFESIPFCNLHEVVYLLILKPTTVRSRTLSKLVFARLCDTSIVHTMYGFYMVLCRKYSPYTRDEEDKI